MLGCLSWYYCERRFRARIRRVPANKLAISVSDRDSKSSTEGGLGASGGGTGDTSLLWMPRPALGRVSVRTIRSSGRGAGAGSLG